jgi:general secretion pathway protein G
LTVFDLKNVGGLSVPLFHKPKISQNYEMKSQSGLTLVEIITVLVILSILMGFLVSRLSGAGDSAKAGINELKMKEIQSYINQYQLRYNALPSSLRDLVQCNEQTGASCLPIVSSEDQLRDVWGTEFKYSVDSGGRTYTLKSLGADRREGGSGPNVDFALTGP